MSHTEAVDQIITCADCGDQFTFTAKDQEFYRQMHFTPPKRCKDCRKKRKLERERR